MTLLVSGYNRRENIEGKAVDMGRLHSLADRYGEALQRGI
jgi:hypothetical protein